jgi:hypothetical protein
MSIAHTHLLIPTLMRALLICAIGSICSCAGRNPDGTYPQKQKTIPFQDYDENTNAHHGAYVIDAMHVRRPMPSHSEWKPIEFYYKHCTTIDSHAHYPKTNTWECSKAF